MFNSEDTKKDDQSILLEQYKLAVEMADNISNRRGTSNAFFLTLHTSLVGLYLFVIKEGSIDKKYAIILPLFGIMVAYIWKELIKSYRQLNSAKWDVIGKMEDRLPAKPFSDGEWIALGSGKDPKKYKPLTATEELLPWLFSAFYFLCIIIIFI